MSTYNVIVMFLSQDNCIEIEVHYINLRIKVILSQKIFVPEYCNDKKLYLILAVKRAFSSTILEHLTTIFCNYGNHKDVLHRIFILRNL